MSKGYDEGLFLSLLVSMKGGVGMTHTRWRALGTPELLLNLLLAFVSQRNLSSQGLLDSSKKAAMIEDKVFRMVSWVGSPTVLETIICHPWGSGGDWDGRANVWASGQPVCASSESQTRAWLCYEPGTPSSQVAAAHSFSPVTGSSQPPGNTAARNEQNLTSLHHPFFPPVYLPPPPQTATNVSH